MIVNFLLNMFTAANKKKSKKIFCAFQIDKLGRMDQQMNL